MVCCHSSDSQQLPQGHFLLSRIGNFDADRVFAWDGCENVDPLRPRGAGDVPLQAHDFIHPHALGRINLVAGDRRPFCDVARGNNDPKLQERFDHGCLDLLQLRGVRTSLASVLASSSRSNPGRT